MASTRYLIALLGSVVIIVLLAGCTPPHGPAAPDGPLACVSGQSDCQNVPSNWSESSCPAAPGAATVISSNPVASAESQRAESVRTAALMRELLTPGARISVISPLARAGYGTLVSLRSAGPAGIRQAPAPPSPPNDDKVPDYTARMAARAAAAADACAKALGIARDQAHADLESAVGHVASGSETGAIAGPMPLARAMSLAADFYALNPTIAHEAILSGVPLDTPLPADGLISGLEGSRMVWIVTTTHNEGNDRRLEARIKGWAAHAGLHVELLPDAYASPQAVLQRLRPVVVTTTPPTTDPTSGG